MNDEFLFRLREPPPAEFARRLKARLDEQDARRFSHSRYLRGIGIALVLGGAAYAVGTGALKMFRATDVEPFAASVASAVTASDRAAGPAALPHAPAGVATPATEPPARAPSDAGVRDGRALSDAAAATQENPSEAPQRGGQLRGLTVVGTPETAPHTERVLQFFERDRLPQPAVETVPASEVLTRICDVASGAIDVLVTFARVASADWESCNPVSRAFAQLPDRVVELVVGYDAAIVARSVLYGRADLSTRVVFLALARNVPDPRGSPEIVANPYRAWYQIDAALPDYIAVIGPALDSPAARALVELVLQPGCAAVPALAERVRLDADRGGELCRRIREDGVYTQYEDPIVTVRGLETDPALFGVFSGDDFVRNRDKLAAAALDGVVPSVETMANGTYSASRTLYVYASRGRDTPGLVQLVETYLQLPAIARVLVAPDDATRREMRSRTGFIPRIGYSGEVR